MTLDDLRVLSIFATIIGIICWVWPRAVKEQEYNGWKKVELDEDKDAGWQ